MASKTKHLGMNIYLFSLAFGAARFQKKMLVENRDGIRGREGESVLPLNPHSLDLSVFVSDMKP